MIQVLIWKNSFGTAAMNHPGHAAIGFGVEGSKPKYYLSYWPHQQSTGRPWQQRKADFHSIERDLAAELGASARAALANGAVPRPGQSNNSYLEFGSHWVVTNQNMNWVRMPDEVIDLPVSDYAKGKVGLNEQRVTDWWRVFKTRLGHEHKYQFISKKINCASLVMAALTVADARSFCSMPKPLLYYVPNDVSSYAKDLVKKINKRQNIVDHNPSILRPKGVTYSEVSIYGIDVPTLAEWKRMSAVKIGRRHSQVEQIDRLLGEYWSLGTHWDEMNCTGKSLKLQEMLEQIQSHIATKPKSDRREAVLKLMYRILEVVKDKAEDDQYFSDVLETTVGKELM